MLYDKVGNVNVALNFRKLFQMDDDKVREMLKRSIIEKKDNLQMLKIALDDQGKTVALTKHYVDIISNMSGRNCC